MNETLLRLIEIPVFSTIIFIVFRLFFRGFVVFRVMLFTALFALWCGEGTAIGYPYGDKIWWSRPLLYTSELVFGVLLARYYIRLLRKPLHEMRNRLEHIEAGIFRSIRERLNACMASFRFYGIRQSICSRRCGVWWAIFRRVPVRSRA